jgi:hypothetical protein
LAGLAIGSACATLGELVDVLDVLGVLVVVRVVVLVVVLVVVQPTAALRQTRLITASKFARRDPTACFFRFIPKPPSPLKIARGGCRLPPYRA